VDLIDAFLILILFITIHGLLWPHSETFYKFHKRLKEDIHNFSA
jgi:hypothetical protein